MTATSLLRGGSSCVLPFLLCLFFAYAQTAIDCIRHQVDVRGGCIGSFVVFASELDVLVLYETLWVGHQLCHNVGATAAAQILCGGNILQRLQLVGAN